MKNNLLLLLCLFSVLGFSQKKQTETPKIKKSELIKMNRLSEFVTIKPKDFKSLTGEFVCKIDNDKLFSQEFKSDTITSSMKEGFAKIAIGTTLYIDIYVNGQKPKEFKEGKMGNPGGQTSAFIITE